MISRRAGSIPKDDAIPKLHSSDLTSSKEHLKATVSVQ